MQLYTEKHFQLTEKKTQTIVSIKRNFDERYLENLDTDVLVDVKIHGHSTANNHPYPLNKINQVNVQHCVCVLKSLLK